MDAVIALTFMNDRSRSGLIVDRSRSMGTGLRMEAKHEKSLILEERALRPSRENNGPIEP